jgi:hypothetical protein
VFSDAQSSVAALLVHAREDLIVMREVMRHVERGADVVETPP